MMSLNELKKINIEVVASTLAISVKKSGENYNGLCPFHSENTPSFVLFTSSNRWQCFGACGEGGTNVDLVMKKLGVDFPSAVNWLRDHFGDYDQISEVLVSLGTGEKPDFRHKIIGYELLRYWHDMLYHTGEDIMFRMRGFTSKTINDLGFGWDGKRYTIPVWSGKPWESPCIGVRLRASKYLPKTAFKYIGKKGHNKPCVYNRHIAKNRKSLFFFAGELDAAMCYQDGLPAVSVVNGMTSFNSFPKNWSHLWFPTVEKVYVVFDRKEAHAAGRLASEWEHQKGRGTAFVIHWGDISPIDNISSVGYDDYNAFRLKSINNDHQYFLEMVQKQLSEEEQLWLLRSLSTRN